MWILALLFFCLTIAVESIHSAFFFLPSLIIPTSFSQVPFHIHGFLLCFVLWTTDFKQKCLCGRRFGALHCSLIDPPLLHIPRQLSMSRIYQFPKILQGGVGAYDSVPQSWLVINRPSLVQATTTTVRSLWWCLCHAPKIIFAALLPILFSSFHILSILLRCSEFHRLCYKCPVWNWYSAILYYKHLN